MMQATDKVMRSAYLPRLAAPPKLLSSQSLEQAESSDVESTQDLDKECYTDADCYQQLLKEFLESRGTGLSQEVASLKHKKRPNTRDRRASKGRRLRYNVQVLDLPCTLSAMLLKAIRSPTPRMHANMGRWLGSQQDGPHYSTFLGPGCCMYTGQISFCPGLCIYLHMQHVLQVTSQ